MILSSCFQHDDSPLSFIYMKEQSVEIFCDQCLLENENKNTNLQDLIHINKAIKQPESIIKGVQFHKSYVAYLDHFHKGSQKFVSEKLKQLENEITILQNQMQTVFQELSECIKRLQNIREFFSKELQKIMKFEEFYSNVATLQLVEDQNITFDAFYQIKENLFQCLSYLKNEDDFKKQLFLHLRKQWDEADKIRNSYSKFDNLKNSFKKFTNLQVELMEAIIPQFNHRNQFCLRTHKFQQFQNQNQLALQLLDDVYSEKLLELIQSRTKKQIIDFKEVFVGSRDGLDGKIFWKKANNKSNLLLIFKSGAGQIFGGFTNCQWIFQENQYTEDQTGSSFLFSYSRDEIYPLKDKSKAIFSGSGFGPCLGGIDVKIKDNFKNGAENLGTAYEFTKGLNKSYLFGATEPNIKECEVYEVIFFKN